MKKYILKNLDCANCAAKLEREIKKSSTVKSVSVDFGTLTMLIDSTDLENDLSIVNKIEPGVQLIEAVKGIFPKKQKSGECCGEDSHDHDHEHSHEHGESGGDELKKEKIKIAAAIILMIGGFITKDNMIISNILFVFSYAIVGYSVIMKAIKNLLKGNPFDEFFLMSFATLAAFFINQFSEAAGVMIFYSVGELLQEISVNNSRKSIKSLLELKPEYANLETADGLKTVNPETVELNNIIVVKPGEKIPLDGEITEGKTQLDTSALTGESVPRSYAAGDNVMAGMINTSGLIKIKVTKLFNESSVFKILEMVENASHKKAETEKFITKFARYYTPAVVILAVLVAVIPPLFFNQLFSEWLYRAIVLLVISCPCALVLSIPLGYFAGIGRAAKNGILVKGSTFFDVINDLNIIMLDKTGTITKGIFEVADMEIAGDMERDKFLEYAALGEANSNHPIAKSIVAYYNQKPDLSRITDYEEISGNGIKAKIDGKEILLGNSKLMKSHNIEFSEKQDYGTIVYMSIDGKYTGNLLIKDMIKEDSEDAVEKLHEVGIEKLVMLTGDNEVVAENVAKTVGIDSYYANLLPEGKVEKLEEEMRKAGVGKKVAFVGDGINDAPVLARADVGIAMGGLGSDAAIETADVVLIDDKISKIADLVKISKKTRRILIENIIFILLIKGIFIVLGVFGLANMWEAVFADVGTALLAVFNAMRILKGKY
ncbi:heavy metal translocating P-type ATPase [Sebaldella sp. S0638]|uniref:heavy metal translocating P-type ATPase n=1 Tax=Sebaldella sp. S0638 TaxID=2957809 RepID=UPI00209CF308|nr:heavy metal translocating P-type ATPase [Sebaldella sp. S0638]